MGGFEITTSFLAYIFSSGLWKHYYLYMWLIELVTLLCRWMNNDDIDEEFQDLEVQEMKTDVDV